MPEHVPSTRHVFRGEKYRYFPGGLTPYGNYPTVNDRRFVTSYGPRTLLYLELPRGQPIRIRTEGQQPRRDWRRRVYPRKKSIHRERDSRVGEDKETIKGRTSSKTWLSHLALVFIQVLTTNNNCK